MTGIQNSRFPNSDLTLLGLGLRLTPGLQEPYSYHAVERYASLNTVVGYMVGWVAHVILVFRLL